MARNDPSPPHPVLSRGGGDAHERPPASPDGHAALSAPLPPVAPLPTTAPQPIAPLAVSGLVVTKSDLIEALRLYVPGLTDLSTIDAERYLLHLTPATPAAEPREEARHG